MRAKNVGNYRLLKFSFFVSHTTSLQESHFYYKMLLHTSSGQIILNYSSPPYFLSQHTIFISLFSLVYLEPKEGISIL